MPGLEIETEGVIKLHGPLYGRNGRSQRPRHRRHPHQKRYRFAVKRGFMAALAHLGQPVVPRTISEAAILHGVTPTYVAAAEIILKTEDSDLVEQVITGQRPLLETAQKVKARSQFVTGFRKMNATDKAAAGVTLTAEALFDECVTPAVGA